MKTVGVHQTIFEEIINLTEPSIGDEPDLINKGFKLMLYATTEHAKIATTVVGDIVRRNVKSVYSATNDPRRGKMLPQSAT